MSEHNPVSRCLLVAVIVLTGQIAVAQSGGTSKGTPQSETRFLNPDGLNKPAGYTHVVVTEPRKLVYISGRWLGTIRGKSWARVTFVYRSRKHSTI
jgi:hypothetical protein